MPGFRRNFNLRLSSQAFKESLWLWTPEKDDLRTLELFNLSLSHDEITSERQQHGDTSGIWEQLSNATRGKILAMVLRTCEAVIYPQVVANFPNCEMSSRLIHNFIRFHQEQEFGWIHPSTIDINRESPEFLAAIIAYGAAVSNIADVRKLGFAMQEAGRIGSQLKFECDNQLTRELRSLQTYALNLDIGLWSGDRRKMEIAESFDMTLLTMVRRAGYFQRFKGDKSLPHPEDTGEKLEAKWRRWIEHESFKRLVLYLFYRDTRSSMSLLSPPLVSYAEISTELPCCNEVWRTKTATEWKMVCLSRNHEVNENIPPLRLCIDDSNPIFENERLVDVDLSLLLTISLLWRRIWQYQEMKSAAKFRLSVNQRNSTLTGNSQHHEVWQMLQHIKLNTTEWLGGMRPATRLLHEQCLMHLFVSLEDVVLFAGKEGEEEARRVFPILMAWAESSDARQALFHAGQLFRAAKEYKSVLMRDASAVAVYHASLVFWAYAVLHKNDLVHTHHAAARSSRPFSCVLIDSEDSSELQRFLLLGKGIPCIQRHVEGVTDEFETVPLSEPVEVMNTMTSFFRKQDNAGQRNCPPLLENLSKLMQSLGKAALGRKSR